ncbi:MAG: hypothetical protein ACKOXM_00550, partial [Agromyces sp.]
MTAHTRKPSIRRRSRLLRATMSLIGIASLCASSVVSTASWSGQAHSTGDVALLPPASLTLTPAASSVKLTWTLPGAPATTTFTVDRSDQSDGSNSQAVATGITTKTVTDDKITPGDAKFTQIVGGNNYTCGLTDTAQVYCWARNTSGQLGIGNTAITIVPTQLSSTGALAGKTVSSLTSGQNHMCALTSDGGVYCWGYNNQGQLGDGTTALKLVPTALATSPLLAGKTVTQIAAGNAHTCALTSDNGVYCWGENIQGQLGNGSTTPSLAPVAVSKTGVLSGKTISSLQARGDTTCVISSDNLAFCWGVNDSGQLGNNSTAAYSAVPVAVSLGGKLVNAISLGAYHACAMVTTGKEILCWGRGTNGQLGNGLSTSSSVPVSVTMTGALSGVTGGTKTMFGLAAASDESCVVTKTVAAPQTTTPICWGLNAYGQVGLASSTGAYAVPTAPTSQGTLAGKLAKQISVNLNTACVLAEDGSVHCRGYGADGQFGDGSTTTSTPTFVATKMPKACGPNSTLISATECSLTPSKDYYYRLSYTVSGKTRVSNWVKTTTTANSASTPTLTASVSGLTTALSWTAATGTGTVTPNYVVERSTSAPGTNPTVLSSALTDATFTDDGTDPIQFTSLAGQMHTTCGLTSDGQVYCWGYNADGETGSMVGGHKLTPTPVYTGGVMAGKHITKIVAGLYHACALSSDSNVFCWGFNGAGQLGNTSLVNQLAPVKANTSFLAAGETLTDLSAGQFHTCAVTSLNKIYCWGGNAYGQLGNASTISSMTPVQVSKPAGLSGKTITAIESRSNFNCVLTSESLAWCWGAGGYGQLGNGASVDSSIPVAVSGGKTFSSITLGFGFSCGIDTSGIAIWCWGGGGAGQLGTGANTVSATPVAVKMDGALLGTTGTTTPTVTPPTRKISALTASSDEACVVITDRPTKAAVPACWGMNDMGQLGVATSTVSVTEPYVSSLPGSFTGKTAAAISINHAGMCVLATDGTVHCRGRGNWGQLGNGVVTGDLVPNPTAVQASVPTLCPADAVPASSTKCSLQTGTDYYYRLSYTVNGTAYASDWTKVTTGSRDVPTLSVTSGTTVGTSWTATSANMGLMTPTYYVVRSSSATGENPSVVYVGSSLNWTDSTATSVAWSQVSVGSEGGCGVISGKAYCWGQNTYGLLGNNDVKYATAEAPVAVDTSGVLSGKTIERVVTNGRFACARTTDSRAACWGSTFEAFGSGATAPSMVPVDAYPAYAGAISDIAVGYESSCIVTSGAVRCSGYNTYGQLGIGTTTMTSTSAAVTTAGTPLNGKTVMKVAAGPYESCAITSDYKAACWGRNNNAQLGNGTTSATLIAKSVYDTLSPAPVETSNINQISLSDLASCVHKVDNTVYCWGTNTSGQLGDGTTTTRFSPGKVISGNMGDAASGFSSVVVATSGTYVCAAGTSQAKTFC